MSSSRKELLVGRSSVPTVAPDESAVSSAWGLECKMVKPDTRKGPTARLAKSVHRQSISCLSQGVLFFFCFFWASVSPGEEHIKLRVRQRMTLSGPLEQPSDVAVGFLILVGRC